MAGAETSDLVSPFIHHYFLTNYKCKEMASEELTLGVARVVTLREWAGDR
jgi:hypothetical protein